MPVKSTWEEYSPDDPIFREVMVQIGGHPPYPKPSNTDNSPEQPTSQPTSDTPQQSLPTSASESEPETPRKPDGQD